MAQWRIVTGFNTPTGFKEWLESKGVKTKKKRQEIEGRLVKGEIIEFGTSSRMRYEMRDELGIFHIERR